MLYFRHCQSIAGAAVLPHQKIKERPRVHVDCPKSKKRCQPSQNIIIMVAARKAKASPRPKKNPATVKAPPKKRAAAAAADPSTSGSRKRNRSQTSGGGSTASQKRELTLLQEHLETVAPAVLKKAHQACAKKAWEELGEYERFGISRESVCDAIEKRLAREVLAVEATIELAKTLPGSGSLEKKVEQAAEISAAESTRQTVSQAFAPVAGILKQVPKPSSEIMQAMLDFARTKDPKYKAVFSELVEEEYRLKANDWKTNNPPDLTRDTAKLAHERVETVFSGQTLQHAIKAQEISQGVTSKIWNWIKGNDYSAWKWAVGMVLGIAFMGFCLASQKETNAHNQRRAELWFDKTLYERVMGVTPEVSFCDQPYKLLASLLGSATTLAYITTLMPYAGPLFKGISVVGATMTGGPAAGVAVGAAVAGMSSGTATPTATDQALLALGRRLEI